MGFSNFVDLGIICPFLVGTVKFDKKVAVGPGHVQDYDIKVKGK